MNRRGWKNSWNHFAAKSFLKKIGKKNSWKNFAFNYNNLIRSRNIFEHTATNAFWTENTKKICEITLRWFSKLFFFKRLKSKIFIPSPTSINLQFSILNNFHVAKVNFTRFFVKSNSKKKQVLPQFRDLFYTRVKMKF